VAAGPRSIVCTIPAGSAQWKDRPGNRRLAKGKLDLFFWGVNGPTYKAPPKEVLEKLNIYAIPSGTSSFVHIVDEILGGDGAPTYTPMTHG
jgi:hypothetical protein